MSEVYVLCQAFDYEGEALLGVYASLEAAQAAAEAVEYPEDELLVYAVEVGSAAQLDRQFVWGLRGGEVI